MGKLFSSKSSSSSPDYFFIALLAILVIFGFVMLMSASSDLAKEKFGDSFYYVNHQLLFGLIPGILGFIFAFFFKYKNYEKLAIPLLLISIVFLMLVFSPLGIKIKGSERWVNFGFFSFQPGEFVKLTFLIFLAAWISRDNARSKSFTKGFLPFLILLGIVGGLLVLQPSTTIAVILGFAAITMYFVAGAKMRFLFGMVLLGFFAVAALIYITPYRFQRIVSFFDPGADPLGATYHISQSLIAIGSGEIFGVGFGESTTKLKYLPEPIGDSIFAVIAEEFGFIGSMFVILLFVFFIWRGLSIARASRDDFGRFLATGFSALIGFQAFINIGAISGLIPLTGVPLPFVSFGGTALAVFLTMGGIVANISKYRR